MGKNYKKVNSLNVAKGCTLTTNCITLQDGQTAKICVDNGQTKIMIENKEVKEEEPKFKKGDVVFLEAQGDNKIYQHIIITKSIYGNRHHFYADFCINENELYYGYESMWFSKEDIKSIRYATEEGKRTIFVAMLNKGLFWDENKMKVRKLKDGDIVTIKVDNGNDWKSIFKEIKDGKVFSYYDLTDYGYLYNKVGPISYINNIISIRYSTTEERQTLFDKIEEQEHKKWNTVTKEFENIRWRAKKGEKYWYLTENLHVSSLTEDNDCVDNDLGEANNYFKTKKLAKAAANQIKELLSKL